MHHKPLFADLPLRPMLTLVAALLIAAAALGLLGCSATGAPADTASASSQSRTVKADAKFEQDRRAILGMAGEYKVSFEFEETMALRDGYELKEPYHSQASELVKVIKDTGDSISMQHLLVVGQGDDQHVVKHWRQDWVYQADAGYEFQGDNVWEPITFSDEQAEGAWVQSVYQVDDSPRYWGIGTWDHRDGVSTWSAAANRPLPRREFSKRDDYQVLGAVNTHVVTDAGWMHYQSNYKLDKKAEDQKVIALESGVNTYTKTDEVDFGKAREYWQKTAPYWQEVRDAWSQVYGQRETIKLANRWKGDKMYTHMFDLADLYWGKADASEAREKIDTIIATFMNGGDDEQVAKD